MTDYTDLIQRLREWCDITRDPLIQEAADAIEKLCAGEDDGFVVETTVFDQEEIHEDCTVVIWRNSVTGEESVGWYENEKEETNGHG